MCKHYNVVFGLVVVGAVIAGVAAVAQPAAATPSENISNSTAKWGFNDEATTIDFQSANRSDNRTKNDTNNTQTSWAATQNATTLTSPTPINVTYTVDRQPTDIGQAAVTVTAVVPDNVVELRLYLDRSLTAPYTITSSPGFSYDNTAGAWTATSPRGSETRVTLTYAIETNTSSSAFSTTGYETVETNNWAFLGNPQLGAAMGWRYYGSGPDVRYNYAVDGQGHAAGGFAYAGALKTYERPAADQSFHLIVPQAADPAVSTPAVLDALAAASTEFTIGDRDPTVTAFLLPDPIRGGGRASGDTFWVYDRVRLTVDSSLFHEYVHTRQAWVNRGSQVDTDASAEWITEASADYYAGLLAWKTGLAEADGFRSYIDTARYSDAVLQDSDKISSESKNYYKGRRVVGALDVRIRQHTDGDHTFTDIMNQINTAYEGEFSYADLRSEVVTVTNESTGTWLDTHVQTEAVPSIPSNIQAAYYPSRISDFNVDISPSAVPVNTASPLTIRASNAENGYGVANATVKITGAGVSRMGRTDADGIFNVSITPTQIGNLSVHISAENYTDASASVSVVQPTGSVDFTDQPVSRNSTTVVIADVNASVNHFARITTENGTTLGTTEVFSPNSNQSDVLVDLEQPITENRTLIATVYTTTGGTPLANDSSRITVTDNPVVIDAPVRDPDDDSVFEDINGDGVFNVNDITALWANRNSPGIRNNPQAFDVNGDGSFNVNDVTALWNDYLTG